MSNLILPPPNEDQKAIHIPNNTDTYAFDIILRQEDYDNRPTLRIPTVMSNGVSNKECAIIVVCTVILSIIAHLTISFMRGY